MRHLELRVTSDDALESAKNTRVRAAKRSAPITDGPYAETKELFVSLPHAQPPQVTDRGNP